MRRGSDDSGVSSSNSGMSPHSSSVSSVSGRRSSHSTAVTALMLGVLPGLLNFVFGDLTLWTEVCVSVSVAVWLYFSLKGAGLPPCWRH